MSAYNPHFTSYCTTHINLKALQHNYTTLRAAIPPHAQGMAIVKSDAYGHGILQCAAALQEVGVASFGVGTVYEGKALRHVGYDQEILILLGAQTLEEMQLCAKYKLTVHLYSQRSLELANAVASKIFPLHVSIKCETGMSRLGFLPEDMPSVVDFLKKNPYIIVDLAATHVSCADMPEKESMVQAQANLFAKMTQDLKAAYPHMRLSLCNSAGSLAYAQLADSIDATVYRFGIALYGGNPFTHSTWQAKGQGLRETMRISSTVIHTYEAKAGQEIGYGATFKAPKDMRIAVLGMGYADGFSRGLSASSTGKPTVVSINNCPAPLCGRVCMGTMMVDISHIDNVQEGQKAWVVDATIGQGEFSMQSLADAWGTIPYEGFCLFGDNTRVYENF